MPEGIDGMQAFVIHITEEESIVNVLKDGRKWKKNCPTSWNGHRRVRYANCRGSNKCGNDNCPYRIEYGVINTVQFQRKEGITVCRGCGQPALSVPCSACRYLSYGKSTIKVYHCGVHTCPVIKKVAKNKNQIAQLVNDNPNIKPSQVQSACVLSAFRQMADWGSVKKQVEATMDKEWISNMKKKIKRDTEPVGHDFEAVVTFKQYCDKKDEYYIYKVNDSRGNPDKPSFVFKMGLEKARMAMNMDRDGHHFLKDEYCFFDGKRKRCRGFVTLTGSVYHPLLRRQVPLATMEATAEDTTNVVLFWTLFNEVLQKVTRDELYKFRPIGWCTDMAGANLAGICTVFGSEAQQQIKTCEFHFKDHRNKKAQRLDEESAITFKSLCDDLLESQTVGGYNCAKSKIDAFVDEDENRRFLKTWIAWWHNRRGFIFRAFAPQDAPKMNQAEVIHAGWTHRDIPNMSLLDVCQADIRDAIVLDVELEGYRNGTMSAGKGPSFSDLQRRKHVREVNKATRMGKEMFKTDLGGHLIDPSSSFCPNQRKQKKQSKKTKGTATIQEWTKTHATSNLNLTASPTVPPSSKSLTHITHETSIPQHSAYSKPIHIASSAQATAVPFVSASQQLLSPASDNTPALQWHSGMSPHIYEVVILPSKVQKCYGCGNAFVDKNRSSPYNLVIKHRQATNRQKRPGLFQLQRRFRKHLLPPIIITHTKEKPTF